MRRLILFLLALALLSTFRTPASAYAGRPARAACRDKSDVGKDILGNVATTLALYSLS